MTTDLRTRVKYTYIYRRAQEEGRTIPCPRPLSQELSAEAEPSKDSSSALVASLGGEPIKDSSSAQVVSLDSLDEENEEVDDKVVEAVRRCTNLNPKKTENYLLFNSVAQNLSQVERSAIVMNADAESKSTTKAKKGKGSGGDHAQADLEQKSKGKKRHRTRQNEYSLDQRIAIGEQFVAWRQKQGFKGAKRKKGAAKW